MAWYDFSSNALISWLLMMVISRLQSTYSLIVTHSFWPVVVSTDKYRHEAAIEPSSSQLTSHQVFIPSNYHISLYNWWLTTADSFNSRYEISLISAVSLMLNHRCYVWQLIHTVTQLTNPSRISPMTEDAVLDWLNLNLEVRICDFDTEAAKRRPEVGAQ